MEKRERRERHRRSQVQNQRHQGGYGNRDNREGGDSRRDTRDSRAPVPKPIPNDQKVIDHTAIPDPHMFDNLKRETDDIAALQVKKHGGKRQIFSNWAKYEIPPEDPDEDQAIGADFETLRQAAQLGSHLQLRSERSWDPKGLPTQSAAFTIDLGVLAAALACLPLYEKLELPLDVFSTDELEHMEHQARFGRETWRQRSAKGVPQQAKEGLALYGSILEKLTGSPSSDNALGNTNVTKDAEREQSPDNSTKDTFDFGTVPSRSAGSNIRKSADREQTPDNLAKDKFDFGMESSSGGVIRKSTERDQTPDNSIKASFNFETEPSHVSSRHAIRKSAEREQTPDNSVKDSFDFGTGSSHAFSRQDKRESVEREQTPNNVEKETVVLTSLPSSETLASTLGKERDFESAGAASQAIEVEAVDVQKEEPAHPPVGASFSVSEPLLQSEAQPQLLNPTASEWTKKKSRSGKNRANKRRSWGQDNDADETVNHLPSGTSQAPSLPALSQNDPQKNSVDQPESRSVPKEKLSHTPAPTQHQSEVSIPTTSQVSEKEKSPHTQVPMTPEAPKPVVSAFVNKEKPRRGERQRDPEPQMVKESPSMPLAQQQKAVSRSTPAREIPQNAPGNPSPRKEEDQLDFLLSLRKPVTAPQHLNFAAPTSAVRATIDEDESVAATPTPVIEKKTEDLEDWLDSMLDD
ncbi:Uncharacterized protein GBIM_14776 [Gryllus bimaculatus]|nr:Uncharacterized protein GBIM_14776 [Gryllus bimaculatus]